MKIVKLIARLRPRQSNRQPARDITHEWAIRDWADLPVHHPRGT